jgi:uncharacterized membrane protein YhaH (DUF805 family)
MSPMFRPFARYLQFSGRATRREFWLFHLLYFLTSAASVVVSAILEHALPGRGANMGFVLSAMVWLIFIPPIIAVTVRRLHDRDRKGWWILLSFVPFGVFVLIALFYLQEGTKGPNRFGPDEKSEAGDLSL